LFRISEWLRGNPDIHVGLQRHSQPSLSTGIQKPNIAMFEGGAEAARNGLEATFVEAIQCNCTCSGWVPFLNFGRFLRSGVVTNDRPELREETVIDAIWNEQSPPVGFPPREVDGMNPQEQRLGPHSMEPPSLPVSLCVRCSSCGLEEISQPQVIIGSAHATGRRYLRSLHRSGHLFSHIPSQEPTVTRPHRTALPPHQTRSYT